MNKVKEYNHYMPRPDTNHTFKLDVLRGAVLQRNAVEWRPLALMLYHAVSGDVKESRKIILDPQPASD